MQKEMYIRGKLQCKNRKRIKEDNEQRELVKLFHCIKSRDEERQKNRGKRYF